MFINNQGAFATTRVRRTLNNRKCHYLVRLKGSGVLSKTSGICLTFRRCYWSRMATNGIGLYSYFHILNWTEKSQSVALHSHMINVLWTKLNGGLSGSCVASSIFYISLFLPCSGGLCRFSGVCSCFNQCIQDTFLNIFKCFRCLGGCNWIYYTFCLLIFIVLKYHSPNTDPGFLLLAPFWSENEAGKWWCSALYC